MKKDEKKAAKKVKKQQRKLKRKSEERKPVRQTRNKFIKTYEAKKGQVNPVLFLLEKPVKRVSSNTLLVYFFSFCYIACGYVEKNSP